MNEKPLRKDIEISICCVMIRCIVLQNRVTIDTPSNREAMPDAEFEDWTHPDAFSDAIYSWATDMKRDVRNGALYEFITDDGETEVEEIGIEIDR